MMSGGELVGGAAVVLPADGVVDLAFNFEVVEPRHSLELYWRLLEGAIEGVLTVVSTQLVRERP